MDLLQLEQLRKGLEIDPTVAAFAAAVREKNWAVVQTLSHYPNVLSASNLLH